MRLSLELPWPPSANAYHGVARARRSRSDSTAVNSDIGIRVYQSPSARKYIKHVSDLIFAYTIMQKLHDVFPLRQRLRVEIHAYPPDKRVHDVDNLNKVLLDALERAKLFKNDSQIDDLRTRVYRDEVKDGGAVLVIVSLMDETDG